jgi:hypothetical protein
MWGRRWRSFARWTKSFAASLADEMVLLRGAEGVLEDGIYGATAQSSQQLTKICRPFTINLQSICSGIEVKKG